MYCDEDKHNVKSLSKIWNDKELGKVFTKQNTLIIEDTKENCVKNVENSIIIPKFSVENALNEFEKDDYLLYLIKYLKTFKDCKDVTKINKEKWWEKVGKKTEQVETFKISGE